MLARGVYTECGTATAEPTTADLLFVEIDQRAVKGIPAVLEVQGIHVVEGRGIWMQLAPIGEWTQAFILYLAPTATVAQALAALDAWGRAPRDRRPRVIEVVTPASSVRLLSR
jgi:hypothetical protein